MPYIPRKEKDRPWILRQKQTIWGNTNDQRIYKSARWRKIRQIMLDENPLCKECRRQNKLIPAVIVDHIIPISKGGAIWDESNLQTLCKQCHNSKTRKEQQR